MPDEKKYNRRRFLITAAMTIAAAQLGLTGCGIQQAAASAAQLPVEGELPSLSGASGWLNSPPLTPAGLRGKVVLADFWTYTCINWRRTFPYVRAWAEKYKDQGLVVIGVHTPEFDFEHDVANVRQAAKEIMVDYPIALDPNYAVWNAFNNQYWPALYIVDAKGQIRHHQFGEGDYEPSERVIQQLLAEAGISGVSNELVSVNPIGAETAADVGDLQSPETYTGYGRSDSFASPGGAVLDKPHVYTVPQQMSLNQWSFAGNWTVGNPAAVLNQAGGQVAYRFHARDLNLVMGPAVQGASVRFRLFIDGQPADTAHGFDVDGQGNGTVNEPRMYQLIRQPTPIVDRQFEIEFLDPGVAVYDFTFG